MRKKKVDCDSFGIVYLCRMCKKRYSNKSVSRTNSHSVLVNSIYNLKAVLSVPLLDIHWCESNKYGVADLVGCEPEKER